MVDGSDDRWLTVSAAARALSVSRQALHHRIKRGTLDSRKGNRGQTLVRIPSTVASPVPGGTVDTAVDEGPSVEPFETVPLVIHREMVEALTEAHSEAVARMEAAHRETVEHLRNDHRVVVGDLRRIIDRLLPRAEAPVSLPRPWWAPGWLGASKRSRLRK